MRKLILEIDISDDAFELLKDNRNKYLEYRDSEYETLEDFKKSDLFTALGKTEEWFLSRNSNGTLYLIKELEKYDLVDTCLNSWHSTFYVTELGKKFIEQNE